VFFSLFFTFHLHPPSVLSVKTYCRRKVFLIFFSYFICAHNLVCLWRQYRRKCLSLYPKQAQESPKRLLFFSLLIPRRQRCSHLRLVPSRETSSVRLSAGNHGHEQVLRQYPQSDTKTISSQIGRDVTDLQVWRYAKRDALWPYFQELFLSTTVSRIWTSVSSQQSAVASHTTMQPASSLPGEHLTSLYQGSQNKDLFNPSRFTSPSYRIGRLWYRCLYRIIYDFLYTLNFNARNSKGRLS